MRQRLIIVYNPRSSRAARVEREVLAPARELKGWTVGKYAVRATNVDDNAARLAKILRAGDLVVTAGGDATATIGVNGVMKWQKACGNFESGSGKNHGAHGKNEDAYGKNKSACGKNAPVLAVLGYGNFNDHARTWRSGRDLAEVVRKFESKKVRNLYPLEVLMDGKHWRWAACYFTVGMFAKSTRLFDEPKVRESLRRSKFRLVRSVLVLAGWYFKHKRKKFVPNCEIDCAYLENGNCKNENASGKNKSACAKNINASDIMAVNSRTVARVMRGGEYYAEAGKFLAARGKLTSFWRLVGFMIKSVFHKIPGEKVSRMKIEFEKSEKMVVQAEGESKEVCVKKIEVVKSKKCLSVI